MKYLGVPLLFTRLSHSDCQPLLDKIMARIQAWTSRALSFAGRLQLLSFFFWMNKNLFPTGKPNKEYTRSQKTPKNEKRTAPPLKQRKRGNSPIQKKHT